MHRFTLPLLALLAFGLFPMLIVRATPPDRSIYLPVLAKSGDGDPVVAGLPFDPFATYSGDGTAYEYTGGGNLTRDSISRNTYIAAINQQQYFNGLLCGAYVMVTGPSGSLPVLIVDRCPECVAGDLDLEIAALQAIAGTGDGRHPISWRLISPPIGRTIGYRFQGSNPFYVKVQILFHRNPIARVEIEHGGAFVELTRSSDGFFLYFPSGALGPITLRVTDIYGNRITDSATPIAVNNTTIFELYWRFPPLQGR